jgi:hypothetical protein
MKEKYRRNKKNQMIPRLDQVLIDALVSLRYFVENQGKQPDIFIRGDTYKRLQHSDIKTIIHDGIEFGYKLKELSNQSFMKKVFVKFNGYDLKELMSNDSSREQVIPYFNTIFEVFLDPGQGLPEMQLISKDTVLLTEIFKPLLLTRTQDGFRDYRVKRYL